MNYKSLTTAAILFLAATVFTACSADEGLDSPLAPSTESEAILFRVDNPSSSRTSTRDFATSVTDFKVTALDGQTPYFSSPMDVFSTDNGSSWISTAETSWPANRPAGWKGLTFIAYVDDAHNGRYFELNDGGASFTGYTVPSDVRSQSDLMYAVAKDVRSGSVGLHFRNALSQITFTAQNNHPAYENVEILSIELGGVKGSGSYYFPKASTATDSKGNWTLIDSPNASYTIDHVAVILPACGSNCKGEIVSLSHDTRTAGDNVMYLIPQNTEESAYIKVTARITLRDAAGASYISEEVTSIAVDWKEGQRYNYNIEWNPTQITFDVKVADFREISISTDL